MNDVLKRLSFAGAIATLFLVQPASAEHRSRYAWIPDFMEPRAGHFFFDDEEEGDIVVVPAQRREASIYDDDLDDYYEPQLQPKLMPQQKKVQKLPATKQPAKKVASIPAAKKKPQAAAGFTCDRGASVVTDYGFSDVKPTTCSGKIYTFKAARTGKSYDVSVSAATGEITEVRKIQ